MDFVPWVGRIPWRSEWLATPVFLPGEFHGQKSLAGYTPWGCKELDTTEHRSMHTHLIFKSLSHFEFIFCMVWECALTSLIYMSCPTFPTPLAEENLLFPLHILASFVEDWLYVCGFIFELSVLFHWSICLVFYVCVCVTLPHYFDYCSFVVLPHFWEGYASCFVLFP